MRLLLAVLPLLLVASAGAQQDTTTDPTEEKVQWCAGIFTPSDSQGGDKSSLFRHNGHGSGISLQRRRWTRCSPPLSFAWNFGGDPCTGAATDNTTIDDNPNFNPAIKCDCTDQNNTVCHVTKLKIYALDAVGPIPEELRNLTRLTSLNLAQNYITGPLPSFLGELTALQYMSPGINALSGPVPKELGNLRNLISLSLSSNNLNGSFPTEFGNLVKLEQLCVVTSILIALA